MTVCHHGQDCCRVHAIVTKWHHPGHAHTHASLLGSSCPACTCSIARTPGHFLVTVLRDDTQWLALEPYSCSEGGTG